jgi:hypothetical protein
LTGRVLGLAERKKIKTENGNKETSHTLRATQTEKQTPHPTKKKEEEPVFCDASL